ncbi:MAG: YihY/virulence factor BrkB family protein [Chloroflexota bacterium]|nr:YihY/virulence factor BrkB family protein [Chloroflexota bacterium]
MAQFFTDLKRILGPRALRRVVRQLLENNGLALAGQLGYLFILFLFPFLIFLVTMVGIVVDDPETTLKDLVSRIESLWPQETTDLIRGYLDRNAKSTSLATFIGSILFTLGVGSAAAEVVSKAANCSYGVPETRSFWRVRGVAILLIFGFTLLVASLAFLVLSPQTGAYLQRALGLSDVLLNFWTILGWLVTILAITIALDVLYYIAPNAEIPFRWVTPGGLLATVLLLIASQIMRLSIAILHYDQLYGQLGAGIVLLIWLYVIGLVVLIGIQINAVLARMAEEHEGTVIVEPPKEAP